MEQDRLRTGVSAAVALRHRSTALRLLLMGVVGLLLAAVSDWDYAGLWWSA